MILAIAATQLEMEPFLSAMKEFDGKYMSRVTGVGPVETALQLTILLARYKGTVSGVVNFGIGGAYISADSKHPELLDICLAECEIAGDFGICLPDGMEYFDEALSANTVCPVDKEWLEKSKHILRVNNIDFHTGNFITVNGVTATRLRADMLQAKWHGLCENMEGASVARVCREFNLPFVELRCMSNLVEERNPASWQLREACVKAAETAALLIKKGMFHEFA